MNTVNRPYNRVATMQELAMDTSATMYLDTRKVHFFEPGKTGMNLSLDRGAAPAANESAHALA
jgi:hypothetical protein